MFHVKKWNIVCEYLKTNLFKRHKYPSPNALNIKFFGHSATNIGGFWVSINYPTLNWKKRYAQKMSWCITVNALFFSLFTFCQKVSFGFLCTCYQLKWFQMQLKPKCVWSYTSVSFVSLYNKKYSRQFILILWHQFLLNMWAISPPWFYLTVMSQIDFIFHFDLA